MVSELQDRRNYKTVTLVRQTEGIGTVPSKAPFHHKLIEQEKFLFKSFSVAVFLDIVVFLDKIAFENDFWLHKIFVMMTKHDRAAYVWTGSFDSMVSKKPGCVASSCFSSMVQHHKTP